jgi:hypothetical protein
VSRLSFFLLFLVFGAGVWAQESRPAVVLKALEQPLGGTEALARSLTELWRNLWVKEGFVVVDGSEAHPARFEAAGTVVREGGTLVLQLSVADLPAHAVVAAEVLSLYEGLTAVGPINEVAAAVTRKTAAYWKLVKDSPLPVAPVEDALVFQSPDEGAELFWQGHESIGKITDGALTAPYYPFPSNAVLTIITEKAGMRTKTTEVQLDPSAASYTLPAMDELRLKEWHSFVQAGRLLGLGTEYRDYFLPEWAFWSAEVYPWVQYRPDVPRSRPVLHLDVAGSVGTWLYFDADSWFRFGVQASLGLNQTVTSSSAAPGWYLDAVVPLGIVMEWNLLGITLENRVQGLYSLGLPTGLVGQRWMLINSTWPLLSVGTLWRW